MLVQYTTLALLSAIGAAVFNILAHNILRQITSRQLLVINFFIMGGVLTLLSPWFYHFTINRYTLTLLLIILVLDTFGNYFYFKSFTKSPASIVTPILALSPAFTFSISWLFFEDTAPLFQYLISAAIIVSIIIFSLDYKNLKQFSAHTLFPALIAALCIGLSAVPTKLLLSSASLNPPTLYLFRSWFIGIVIWLIFRDPLRNITLKQIGNIATRSAVVLITWLLFYYALAIGDPSITVTLNSTAPVFVFILSAVFLKEKMTWQKLLAAGLIVVLSLTL